MNDEQKLAIEYFKALRSEIDLRIKNHGYLTISKIVACAALLGHLVGTKADLSALVTVPVLAFGLDLVIYHNLGRVNAVGKYIKRELEQKAFKGMVTRGWKLCERNFQSNRRGVFDIVLDRSGQLVTTSIFAVLAFVLASPQPASFLSSGLFWLIAVLLWVDGMAAYLSRASD